VADRFHGACAGERAEAAFDRVYREGRAPQEIPEVRVPPGAVHLPALLVEGLGVSSRSEARRLLDQGGVSLDGEPLTGLDHDAGTLDGRVLRAGKRRFARVRVAP
jgi:tyrosyl-tRNA synthetase